MFATSSYSLLIIVIVTIFVYLSIFSVAQINSFLRKYFQKPYSKFSQVTPPQQAIIL